MWRKMATHKAPPFSLSNWLSSKPTSMFSEGKLKPWTDLLFKLAGRAYADFWSVLAPQSSSCHTMISSSSPYLWYFWTGAWFLSGACVDAKDREGSEAADLAVATTGEDCTELPAGWAVRGFFESCSTPPYLTGRRLVGVGARPLVTWRRWGGFAAQKKKKPLHLRTAELFLHLYPNLVSNSASQLNSPYTLLRNIQVAKKSEITVKMCIIWQQQGRTVWQIVLIVLNYHNDKTC